MHFLESEDSQIGLMGVVGQLVPWRGGGRGREKRLVCREDG